MVKTSLRPWLAVVLALGAGQAWSAWKTANIGVTQPNDINLVDAGAAALSANQGAFAVYMGPADTTMTFGNSIDAGAFVGARLGPNGCVYGLPANAALGMLSSSAADCGPNFTLVGNNNGHSFLTTETGAGFAVSTEGTRTYFNYHGDAGQAGPWTEILRPGISPAKLLGATTASGLDVAVAAFAGADSGTAIRIDGGPGLQAAPFNGAISQLTAWRHGARPAYLIGYLDGGMAVHYDFARVENPAPAAVNPQGEVIALGFTEEGGDLYGSGFGFAGTDAGLYGAIPRGDNPGAFWVRRDAGFLPNMIRARCLSAYNCVILSADPGNAAIGWYYNLNAPSLVDGGTAVRIRADAGSTVHVIMPIVDLDGDPMWFTYEGDAGGVVLSTSGISREETDVTVPSSVQCGGETFTFAFRVSDGLSTNVRQFTGVVDVPRNDPPGAPVLSGPGVVLYSGLGPQFVGVSVPSTGCPATSLTATPPSNAGFTITPTDGGYFLTPSGVYCSLDGGGSVPITLGNDAGSATSNLQVTVVPWGFPDAGSFVPASVSFDAGDSTTVGLSMGHACQGANGFPGLDVTFTVDGGGPTVSVSRAADGGLRIASSDPCTAAQLQVTAKSFVVGEDAGRVSLDSATLNVSVNVNYPSLTGAEFDAGASYDDANAIVTGCAELAAVCIAQRGLGAQVTVYGTGGSPITDAGTVPLGGCGPIGVPGGCNGGTFFARVQVVGNTGAPMTIFKDFQFDAGYRRATVGSVATPEVSVTCGQPVSFTASAQGSAAGCLAQEFGWSQVSGPPVSFAPAVGDQTTVTLDPGTDFDLLAGGKVRLQVTSDAGFGNVSLPFFQDVTLKPGEFVAMAHDYEPLPAREGEALPVRTTLTNTTGCAVSGLELVETLGALSYVEGSARVNGARVEVQAAAGGELRVGPIALAENGKAVVTWLARTPMTSRPAVTGRVEMRDDKFKVSIDEAPRQPVACGCGSAPATGALALLALARLFRRSRKR
jgi:hypothetical protein